MLRGKTLRENLLMGGVFWLVYVLVYGSISMRAGLLWDEMLDAEGGATGQYVAAGRWGLALYRHVFGVGVFPLVASLLAGAYIAAALVWQIRLLKLESRLHRLFYGGIYLACIQWAYQLEFSHQCDAVALGLLGATAAVWAMGRRRWLLAVVVLALALGMYQTVGLYALCLMLAVWLAGDGALRAPMWGGLACLAGAFVLSMGVARLAFLLPWVSAEEIATQRAYQADMSRWSYFPSDASLGEQAEFVWYYGSRFFKMTCRNMLGLAYAGQWVYATALVPLGCLLAGVWRGGLSRKSVWHGVGFLLLWALPFCPILLLFTDQGPRVNMAEPLALAALWGLALPGMERRPGGAHCRWACALVVLLAVAVVKASYRVGDIAWNEARIFDQEVACVRALHTRGMAAAEAAGLDSPQILLVGGIPSHREVTWPRRECFEEHSAMTPPEHLGFYTRYLQIDNVRRASEQESLLHGAAYSTMPTWPAAGSVRVDGADVIIRVD